MIDLHTHLYPQNDDRCLSGLNELLNYHYVLGEFFKASGKLKKDIQLFNLKTKEERSEEIWDTLFRGQTTHSKYQSEHIRGVHTCISGFAPNVNPFYSTYANVIEKYDVPTLELALHCVGLTQAVATYDIGEEIFDDDIIIPSFRIDRLTEFCMPDPIDDRALYYAFSCESSELHTVNNLKGNLIDELKEHNKPLWIMLGVKRGVTPYMDLGGDSIGECDILKLVEFANHHPDLKIPFSILDPSKIHEAIVASRVTPNLFFSGHWWFNNIPSSIKHNMQTAVELVGYENFIHYYSDARVVDQLLYKWKHYYQIKKELGYELHLSDGRLRETLFGAGNV